MQVTGATGGYKATSATSAEVVVAGRSCSPGRGHGQRHLPGRRDRHGRRRPPGRRRRPHLSVAARRLADRRRDRDLVLAGRRGRGPGCSRCRVTGTAAGYQPASAVSVPLTVARASARSDQRRRCRSRRSRDARRRRWRRRRPRGRHSAGPRLPVAARRSSRSTGATAASYTPVPADAGGSCRCRSASPAVAAGLGGGDRSAGASSAPPDPELRGTWRRSAARSRRSPGRGRRDPTFAYQWLLDGKPIKGATRRDARRRSRPPRRQVGQPAHHRHADRVRDAARRPRTPSRSARAR